MNPAPINWEHRKERTHWWVKILAVLWGLAIIPVLPYALFSVMIFDAPGSEDSILTNVDFWASFTAPAVLLLACIGGILAPYKTAKWIVLLPITNLVAFVLAMVLGEILCDGRFACWL